MPIYISEAQTGPIHTGSLLNNTLRCLHAWKLRKILTVEKPKSSCLQRVRYVRRGWAWESKEYISGVWEEDSGLVPRQPLQHLNCPPSLFSTPFNLLAVSPHLCGERRLQTSKVTRGVVSGQGKTAWVLDQFSGRSTERATQLVNSLSSPKTFRDNQLDHKATWAPLPLVSATPGSISPISVLTLYSQNAHDFLCYVRQNIINHK